MNIRIFIVTSFRARSQIISTEFAYSGRKVVVWILFKAWRVIVPIRRRNCINILHLNPLVIRLSKICKSYKELLYLHLPRNPGQRLMYSEFKRPCAQISQKLKIKVIQTPPILRIQIHIRIGQQDGQVHANSGSRASSVPSNCETDSLPTVDMKGEETR